MSRSLITRWVLLKKTINKINQLATDGFKIILTDNILKSNSILYLCSKEKIAKLNPDFYRILNDIANNEGVLTELPSSKKKKADAFSENKKELKLFIKENKLNINKEKDLIKLAEYVNTL